MNDKFYRSYLNIIKEDSGEETDDPTPDQFMVDDDEHGGYYNIHFCISQNDIFEEIKRLHLSYDDVKEDAEEFYEEFCRKWNVKAYDNADGMIQCEAVIPEKDLKLFVTYYSRLEFMRSTILDMFTQDKNSRNLIDSCSNDDIFELLFKSQRGDVYTIKEVDSADAYDYSYDEQPLAFVVSEMVEDYFN